MRSAVFTVFMDSPRVTMDAPSVSANHLGSDQRVHAAVVYYRSQELLV